MDLPVLVLCFAALLVVAVLLSDVGARPTDVLIARQFEGDDLPAQPRPTGS